MVIKILSRNLIFFIFLVVISACDLPNSVKQPTINDTINDIVTKMDGEGMLSTVQAVATQQGGSALATASSLTSSQGADIFATVEAFSTTEGEKFKATLGAFATQEGGQIPGTLQAMLQNNDIPATIEAYLGEIQQPLSEDIPEDIPLVNSQNINKLFKTPQLITYTTTMDYDDVISFYKTQMPSMGWIGLERGTTEMDAFTFLKFSKKDREASISIYKNQLGKSTIVIISISRSQ